MVDGRRSRAGRRRTPHHWRYRQRIVVSAASLREIAIKRRRGRLAGVDEYLARYGELHARWGFESLVIEPAAAVAAGSLAVPHDDPFDRMLIAQARRPGARVVTCDEAIRAHEPAASGKRQPPRSTLRVRLGDTDLDGARRTLVEGRITPAAGGAPA